MENIVAFNCNQFWVKECVCLLLGLSYDSLRAYHLAPFSPLSECKQGYSVVFSHPFVLIIMWLWLLPLWLQFISWPNNSVIESWRTNRRTPCRLKVTQDMLQFKIFFCYVFMLQIRFDVLKMFARVQILAHQHPKHSKELPPPWSQFALELWIAAKCASYFYPESMVSLDLSRCRSLAEAIACTWPVGPG